MLINTIAPIHRYLGETMMLIALISIVLAIVGLLRKKKLARTERILGLVYNILLDIQLVLGVIFYFLLPGPARPTLLHPIIMVLAVIVVHVSRAKRNGPRPTCHQVQLGVYVLSLALVLIGRMILA